MGSVEAPPLSTINAAYTHVRDEIIDFIPDGARSVLDVGCSNGATGAELKRRDPSIQVVGVDISEQAVLDARRIYDLTFACGLDDSQALSPLGGRRFDVVIAPDVLEHLRDPVRALNTLAHHLADGGVIVVSLPNIQHVGGIATILGGRFPRQPSGLFDETHLRWFTRREAESTFAACGLRVTASRRNLQLTLSRRAKPLWPILSLAGDLFAVQLIFKLERMGKAADRGEAGA